jgi:hypothetical protein
VRAALGDDDAVDGGGAEGTGLSGAGVDLVAELEGAAGAGGVNVVRDG